LKRVIEVGNQIVGPGAPHSAQPLCGQTKMIPSLLQQCHLACIAGEVPLQGRLFQIAHSRVDLRPCSGMGICLTNRRDTGDSDGRRRYGSRRDVRMCASCRCKQGHRDGERKNHSARVHTIKLQQILCRTHFIDGATDSDEG
jgi:hypothetical protein